MKKQLLRVLTFVVVSICSYSTMNAQKYHNVGHFLQTYQETINNINNSITQLNGKIRPDKTIAKNLTKLNNFMSPTQYQAPDTSTSAANNVGTANACKNIIDIVKNVVTTIITNITTSLNNTDINQLPTSQQIQTAFDTFKNQIIKIAFAFIPLTNNSTITFKNKLNTYGRNQVYEITKQTCDLIEQTINLIESSKNTLVGIIQDKQRNHENNQQIPQVRHDVQTLQQQLREQVQRLNIVLRVNDQQIVMQDLQGLSLAQLRQLQQQLASLRQVLNQEEQEQLNNQVPLDQLFNHHWINLHVAGKNDSQDVKVQIAGNNGQIQQNGQIIKQTLTRFFNRILGRQNPNQWLESINQHLENRDQVNDNVNVHIVKPIKLMAQLPIPQGGNIQGIIANPVEYFDWFTETYIPAHLDAEQNFNEQIAFIIELIAINDANIANNLRNIYSNEAVQEYFNALQAAKSLTHESIQRVIASFKTAYAIENQDLQNVIAIPFFPLLVTYVDQLKLEALQDDTAAQNLKAVCAELRRIANEHQEFSDQVSVIFRTIIKAWTTKDTFKKALEQKQYWLYNNKNYVHDNRGLNLLIIIKIADTFNVDITDLENAMAITNHNIYSIYKNAIKKVLQNNNNNNA